MTRRHRFFCTNRQRHSNEDQIVEIVPRDIEVLGRRISGWLITTEEPVIDKFIPLDESMHVDSIVHDPE
ncbi:MAG: hypothetical protein GKR89_09150 [Candidatus Latescibacteria bacterium]|nr:hypothetical protein [Candidatus Latescibacterota bacterium]